MPCWAGNGLMVLCALGPALGVLIGAYILPSSPVSQQQITTHLLDFRPVLANRKALGFTLAYAAHNAELFGFRTWIVAFLLFCQAQQSPNALGLGWSAATLAALLNLVGMPASIITNEIAQRRGRELILLIVMSTSALIAVALGFAATATLILVLLLATLYGVLIMADSATITAGMVMAAEPRYRGVTMAFYSLIGFIGAFTGPIVFGAVLDLAGGETSARAWGLAFSSLAAMVLLGPAAIVKFLRGCDKSH